MRSCTLKLAIELKELLNAGTIVEKNLTPLLVVAAALVAPDGRVLLQRRPAGVMHEGLWEFPGGKVDPGESAEMAVVRELEEELGIGVQLDALMPVGFASGLLDAPGQAPLSPDAGQRGLVILLYAVVAWTGEPDSREEALIGWYEPEAIMQLAMPPLDYPLAKSLKSWLYAEFPKKIGHKR